MERLRMCLFAVLLLFADCISAGVIEDMPPGTWYEVPNSRIRDVLPDPIPPGNGPVNIIRAWNSGAYDTLRDRYLITGGGHNDYGGNEIYAFDINTLKWSRIWGPSPNIPPTHGSCYETYPDGNPASRHTYDGIEYIPNIDRLFMHGGSLWCGSGGSSSAAWHFDIDSLSWLRKNDVPFCNQLEMVSVHDPSTGHIFMNGPASCNSLYEYNPLKDSWTDRGAHFIAYGQNAALDPKRRLMVAIGNGQLYSYNLSASVINRIELSTTGDNQIVQSRYPGIDYDAVADRLVAWHGGADVYVLDNAHWTRVSPAAHNTVIPSQAPSQGTYGRWRYVPSKNVFITVNSIDENVYLYRFSAASPLASVAENMQPGTWAELGTDGLVPVLNEVHGIGATGSILAYSTSGVWDPATRKVYYVGSDHIYESGSASYSPRFITYAESDNTWRAEPEPPFECGCVNHGYDHSTIDLANGIYYYHTAGSVDMYSYDISSGEWSTIADLDRWTCCGGLAYFPERKGLYHNDGTSLYFWDETSNRWSEVASGLIMGEYHNFAEYSPVHKVMIFGGGNLDNGQSRDVYKMTAAGIISKIADAPCGIHPNWAKVTTDPVKGDFLILCGEGSFHAYDLGRDHWNQIQGEVPLFDMHNGYDSKVDLTIAVPISTYGVIMFIKHDPVENASVYLYKHNQMSPRSIHPADTDASGCIDLAELLTYINIWRQTEISMVNLMEAISIWKTC